MGISRKNRLRSGELGRVILRQRDAHLPRLLAAVQDHEQVFHSQPPLKCKHLLVIKNPRDPEIPASQRRLLFPQRDGASVKVVHLAFKTDRIRRTRRPARIDRLRLEFQLRPHHRHPVIGIIPAPHARLIAVVDHRRTGARHLEKHHQPLNRPLALVWFPDLVRSRRPVDPIRVVVNLRGVGILRDVGIHDHGREPIRVMRIHEILHEIHRARRQRAAPILDQLRKLRRRDPPVHEEALHRNRKAVVIHRRGKTALGDQLRGIRPDLAARVRVRIQRAHMRRPVRPEFRRTLRGHIQPPAVHAVGGIAVAVRIHPAFRRHKNVRLRSRRDVVPVRRCRKDRQRLVAPPPAVIELVAPRLRIVERLHDIPAEIPRLPLIFPQIPERKKIAPGVIEHAVNDHAHPPAVRLRDHAHEELVRRRPLPGRRIAARLLFDQRDVAMHIGAEIRVYVMIAVTIVFVQRPRKKERVKIKRVHAEFGKVVQLVEHALQVAAVSPVEHAVLEKIRPDFLLPFVARIPIRRPR